MNKRINSHVSVCKCGLTDHKSLMDDSLLENMLKLEENYALASNYFQRKNKKTINNIKPSMRTTLAVWMLEVCEEQRCTDQVYSLSMSIFDRFMWTMECGLSGGGLVEKQHLQLIGTVCLFIAGKLKSVGDALSALKLVEFTDYSVTLDELIEWELLVLDKLRWDVAGIVANDFLDILLHKCMSHFQFSTHEYKLLKKHSQTLTALCSTELKFALYPASMVAVACILCAFDALKQSQLANRKKNKKRTELSGENFCDLLRSLTAIETVNFYDLII
jgi:G1/S-specific cyclin-D2